MEGSCFFQPKVFIKTKAVQEQNGFLWEEINFLSLQEVFKRVGQIIMGESGIFKATLTRDREGYPRWLLNSLPVKRCSWVQPSPRNPFSFLWGLAHSCAHVSSPLGSLLTWVPSGYPTLTPVLKFETCSPRPFPEAHASCPCAALAAGASLGDRSWQLRALRTPSLPLGPAASRLRCSPAPNRDPASEDPPASPGSWQTRAQTDSHSDSWSSSQSRPSLADPSPAGLDSTAPARTAPDAEPPKVPLSLGSPRRVPWRAPSRQGCQPDTGPRRPGRGCRTCRRGSGPGWQGAEGPRPRSDHRQADLPERPASGPGGAGTAGGQVPPPPPRPGRTLVAQAPRATGCPS